MSLAHESKMLTFDEDHPGARFLADHALQLEASRGLLAIADGLPDAAEHGVAQRFIEIFKAAWSAHVRFHEEVIYPLLKRREEGARCTCAGLLERQHAEIMFATDELAEGLAAVPPGTGVSGYLLRHIAERQRDHIETEQALLLPALPQTLAPIERKTYLEWATANPWPLNGSEFGN